MSIIKSIISIVLLYVIYNLIYRNYIEKFEIEEANQFIKKECKIKDNKDVNLYKYSLNSLSNVYSLTNDLEHNYPETVKYYKDIATALSNKKNETTNNQQSVITVDDESNENIEAKNNENNKFNQNSKANLCETCIESKPKLLIKQDPNSKVKNISILSFEKIISLNTEIEFQNKNTYYFEYSNKYLNDLLKNISTNEYISLKDFIDITLEIPVNIYQKIETLLLDKINNLLQTVPNNIVEEQQKIATAIKFDIYQRYINLLLINNQSGDYYIDFDILIYREGKQNGKHINCIILYQKEDINIISIEILGIVIDYEIRNNLKKYSKKKKKLEYIGIDENTDYINMSEYEINKYIKDKEFAAKNRDF